MLAFFPNRYPDELLYSVIARYHVWSRNKTYSNTLEDIFGKNKLAAVVDFPSGLQWLSEQLPSGSEIYPKNLIDENTLFPLFRPFLPQNRVISLEQKMRDGGAGGNKIHASIGLSNSFQIFSKRLRYCSACVSHDFKKYGEAYWHRSHQIAAVRCCHIHQTPLSETKILFRDRSHKNHFIDLNMIERGGDEVELKSDFPFHDLKCAEAVHWFLNNNAPSSSINQLKNQYINRLKELDFAPASGIVRLRRLFNEFNSFFSEDYLRSINCSLNYIDEHAWLKSFFRNIHKSQSPLHHILVMQFLGITPQTLFEKEHKFQPFDEAPWPCFNPAARHCFSNVVMRCDLKTDYNSGGQTLGTFYCNCGFVYTKLANEDYTSRKYKYRDVKSFGHVWEDEVHRLAKQEKLSACKIALKLNSSYYTILKYLQIKEEDIRYVKRKSGRTPKLVDNKDLYRKEWIANQDKHPNKSKTELSKLIPNVFRWLSNRDKEWLTLNSPQKKPSQKYSLKNMDWFARDEELLEKVKEASISLLNIPGKPIRITAHSIGNKMGGVYILGKRINQLPKTKLYISEVAESIDEFRIRKARYLAQMLQSRSETVTTSKLARLLHFDLNSVSKVVQNQLEELTVYKQEG